MKTMLASLCCALLPGAVAAQDVCTGPEPYAMPECLVGAWYGESDMAEKMQAILESIPEHMRASMGGDIGRYLFLSIYGDGYFATSPLSDQIDGQIFSEGDWADFSVDMLATPGTGWMWAGESGALGFCTNPGSGMGLTLTRATNEMGTRHGVTLSRLGLGVDEMLLNTTCDGDLLLMTIDLPEPIGTVTYQLNRIPEAEMPREMRALYEDRFGG